VNYDHLGTARTQHTTSRKFENKKIDQQRSAEGNVFLESKRPKVKVKVMRYLQQLKPKGQVAKKCKILCKLSMSYIHA
jgi:hypothetical protein